MRMRAIERDGNDAQTKKCIQKKHVDDEEKKSAEIQRSERTMFDVCLSFFDRAYLFTFM